MTLSKPKAQQGTASPGTLPASHRAKKGPQGLCAHKCQGLMVGAHFSPYCMFSIQFLTLFGLNVSFSQFELFLDSWIEERWSHSLGLPSWSPDSCYPSSCPLSHCRRLGGCSGDQLYQQNPGPVQDERKPKGKAHVKTTESQYDSPSV